MSAPLTLIEWQGIEIVVRSTAGQLPDVVHIELYVDGKQRIPVTETGYHSRFVLRASIEPFGSIEAYVLAWLNRSAQSRSWRAYVEASRQLSLF